MDETAPGLLGARRSKLPRPHGIVVDGALSRAPLPEALCGGARRRKVRLAPRAYLRCRVGHSTRSRWGATRPPLGRPTREQTNARPGTTVAVVSAALSAHRETTSAPRPRPGVQQAGICAQGAEMGRRAGDTTAVRDGSGTGGAANRPTEGRHGADPRPSADPNGPRPGGAARRLGGRHRDRRPPLLPCRTRAMPPGHAAQPGGRGRAQGEGTLRLARRAPGGRRGAQCHPRL